MKPAMAAASGGWTAGPVLAGVEREEEAKRRGTRAREERRQLHRLRPSRPRSAGQDSSQSAPTDSHEHARTATRPAAGRRRLVAAPRPAHPLDLGRAPPPAARTARQARPPTTTALALLAASTAPWPAAGSPSRRPVPHLARRTRLAPRAPPPHGVEAPVQGAQSPRTRPRRQPPQPRRPRAPVDPRRAAPPRDHHLVVAGVVVLGRSDMGPRRPPDGLRQRRPGRPLGRLARHLPRLGPRRRPPPHPLVDLARTRLDPLAAPPARRPRRPPVPLRGLPLGTPAPPPSHPPRRADQLGQDALGPRRTRARAHGRLRRAPAPPRPRGLRALQRGQDRRRGQAHVQPRHGRGAAHPRPGRRPPVVHGRDVPARQASRGRRRRRDPDDRRPAARHGLDRRRRRCPVRRAPPVRRGVGRRPRPPDRRRGRRRVRRQAVPAPVAARRRVPVARGRPEPHPPRRLPRHLLAQQHLCVQARHRGEDGPARRRRVRRPPARGPRGAGPSVQRGRVRRPRRERRHRHGPQPVRPYSLSLSFPLCAGSGGIY